MSNERLAIALEFFSFFLVTIDLLGVERLKKANDSTSILSQKIEKWDLQHKYDSMRGVIDAFFRQLVRIDKKGGLYVYFFASASLLYLGIAALLAACFVGDKTRHILLPVALIVFGIGFISAAFPYLLLLAFKSYEWFVKKVLGGLVRVIERHKLEGVLLVSGSILFIISKAISFLSTP